jgi:hypothetical protein
MKTIRISILTGICGLFFGITALTAQITPVSSGYNQNIEWESVFTDGPPGKVNRAVVDSDGNYAVIFMPDNQSRIHKIDGNNGERIWTVSIDNTAGFGITEINDAGRCDYIVIGGIGATQERWVARLNGDDGSTMWSKTYYSDGGSWEYDAVRMTIVGSDGYIYGSGFIRGEEEHTIFMDYGGEATVMKIDPDNGDEIWTHSNPNTAYALALVEASDGHLYYGSAVHDEDLTLTKLNTDGSEIWTRDLPGTDMIIPSDMAIDLGDTIYYAGHAGRSGAGHPYDYSNVKLDTAGNVYWVNHYANPRGYSLSYIRSELYGVKVGPHGVYLFGGTGDENGSYSVENPPFVSSDIWNGWVIITDRDASIIRSDVYCQAEVNTATEYGCITENGYVIFNDTDAQGDTEVGVLKIVFDSIPGSGTKFELTSSAGSGGSVFPEGINSCEAYTIAPLVASAEEGYRFDHWSGDISGSENPKTVVMDANKTITAHFVSTTGSGPELTDNQNIITYPNPARGESISIQITDVQCMVNIEIIDVNGRLVLSKNEEIIGNRLVQLPIKEMPYGIYILSISSDHFRHNQKLIIG